MFKKMILKGAREGLGRVVVFVDYITRPRPMRRSGDVQQKVNLEAGELSLYQFYACPFCVKTRRAIHRLNLPITLKNAQAGPYREELAAKGGRVKVPCLRIEEAAGVRWMYNSKDIIQYLDTRFSKAA